jgi:sulfoxide reductase heme-binding subunit YedZ
VIDVLRASGWSAALLLVATLAMTPLARLFPAAAARARRARRLLGITCAVIALLHAALASSTYLGWSAAWAAIEGVAWLRSGALAAALLFLLLLTSFPRVVAGMRVRAWKPLHRLAYPAAALALHHALYAPFAPRAWGIALSVVLVGLAIARISPQRRAVEQESAGS